MAVFKANGKILKANGKVLKSEDGTVVIDGRKYRTVTIGNQTWLAENLSVDAGTWIEYPNEPERGKYYYDRSIGGTPFSAITAKLPNGWRIPSSSDFNALIAYCSPNSATKLKSTDGWMNGGNGTDEFGFNLKPYQRYWTLDTSHWGVEGQLGSLWTSDTSYYAETGYVRNIFDVRYNISEATISYRYIEEFYLNIRLVKDA